MAAGLLNLSHDLRTLIADPRITQAHRDTYNTILAEAGLLYAPRILTMIFSAYPQLNEGPDSLGGRLFSRFFLATPADENSLHPD